MPTPIFARCLLGLSLLVAASLPAAARAAEAAANPAAPAAAASPLPAEAAMLGVNLACGEFGPLPGTFNRDYTYPGAKQFDYCRAKGLSVIRVPLKWERLQRTLRDPLDETELKRLDDVVKLARDRDLRLLLDLHNYGRYGKQIIGTPEVPNEAFADFWKKLAAHYRDEPAIFAYGLMNEPHDTGGRWPAAAQAAIDAIRTVDRRHTISVCGDGWSGAHSWKAINNNFVMRDPAENLVYEAHQYFDRDNSGTYRQAYDDSGATADIGPRRLEPFVAWLAEHHARGFIGEFGVPDDDPRWLVVLDNFVAAMKAHQLGGTYWAAGPWWGKYPQSVEPRQGQDRPQMAVLELYAGSRNKPTDAKPAYVEAAARIQKPVSLPPAKPLPAGTKKQIYDFGTQKDPYHYTNEGSELNTKLADDAGRKFRHFAYQHRGKIAWVGVGLYFGSLDCRGYSAFRLAIRAEKPCKLEIKAYRTAEAKYAASFAVGTEWQELLIPFEALKGADGSFDSRRGLLKIEFQPSPDHRGSSIDLGMLELLAQ